MNSASRFGAPVPGRPADLAETRRRIREPHDKPARGGLLALSALSIGLLVACADNGPSNPGPTSTSPSTTTVLTSPPGALKTPQQATESPVPSAPGG